MTDHPEPVEGPLDAFRSPISLDRLNVTWFTAFLRRKDGAGTDKQKGQGFGLRQTPAPIQFRICYGFKSTCP